MGMVSWILLGAVVGVVADRLAPAGFPGGTWGTIVGGVLGAALGGLSLAVAAGRGLAAFDPVSLVTAFGGAALLLVLVRAAGPGAVEVRERR